MLNLKQPEAVQAFLKLAAEADVIVESFRAGVVDRLGIGYKTVAALNPRIVYCSISAFGQTGPYAKRVAHDLSIEAESGVVSLNVAAGETLALVGESGCGKSVTALSIMRLMSGRVAGGSIRFGGRDLASLSEPEMRGSNTTGTLRVETLRGLSRSMARSPAVRPIFSGLSRSARCSAEE